MPVRWSGPWSEALFTSVILVWTQMKSQTVRTVGVYCRCESALFRRTSFISLLVCPLPTVSWIPLFIWNDYVCTKPRCWEPYPASESSFRSLTVPDWCDSVSKGLLFCPRPKAKFKKLHYYHTVLNKGRHMIYIK